MRPAELVERRKAANEEIEDRVRFSRYNHGRVHQGLNAIPDPDVAIEGSKPLGGRLVGIPVLNGLHHDYRVAA